MVLHHTHVHPIRIENALKLEQAFPPAVHRPAAGKNRNMAT